MSLPQFQVFGFILIVLGGYLLVTANWLGLIPLVVGLVLFLSTVGIQIDFSQPAHREYYGIFGFKFGKWKELPPVEYVTVFIEQYAQRGSLLTIDNINKFSKVKVSLIVSRTIRFDGGYFNSKEKAIQAGLLIAKKLKVELLDYTGKEPEWIDY